MGPDLLNGAEQGDEQVDTRDQVVCIARIWFSMVDEDVTDSPKGMLSVQMLTC